MLAQSDISSAAHEISLGGSISGALSSSMTGEPQLDTTDLFDNKGVNKSMSFMQKHLESFSTEASAWAEVIREEIADIGKEKEWVKGLLTQLATRDNS